MWNYVGREMAGKIYPEDARLPRNIQGIFYMPVNLRHGTHSFTSLLKGRRAEDFFFRPEKSDGLGRVCTRELEF
jgi:hypothetical protein